MSRKVTWAWRLVATACVLGELCSARFLPPLPRALYTPESYQLGGCLLVISVAALAFVSTLGLVYLQYSRGIRDQTFRFLVTATTVFTVVTAISRVNLTILAPHEQVYVVASQVSAYFATSTLTHLLTALALMTGGFGMLVVAKLQRSTPKAVIAILVAVPLALIVNGSAYQTAAYYGWVALAVWHMTRQQHIFMKRMYRGRR